MITILEETLIKNIKNNLKTKSNKVAFDNIPLSNFSCQKLSEINESGVIFKGSKKRITLEFELIPLNTLKELYLILTLSPLQLKEYRKEMIKKSLLIGDED
jgi:hypothetical protein